ncbi:MAG: peptidylprolyl isomerase [Lachnospiraceae bacterium]|nr:peptidylprolyl isomerase [Lachnospiraceae bacterium]
MKASSFAGIRKHCINLCGMLLLCIPLLAACGRRIVFTDTIGEDVAFRLGGRDVYLYELEFYEETLRETYVGAYGAELLTADPALAESIRNDALLRLSKTKALCLLAERDGVVLTEEEKAAVREEASALYEKYGADDEALTLSRITQIRSDDALAEKMYRQATRQVGIEISDEEARVAECESIFVPTVHEPDNAAQGEALPYSEEEKTAARLLIGRIFGDLSNGASFSSMASAYSGGRETHVFIRRSGIGSAEGMITDAQLAEAAFGLQTGQVSDIIETGEGYRILKCITNFNREQTDRNKEILLEERRAAAFASAFDAFADSLDIFIGPALSDE